MNVLGMCVENTTPLAKVLSMLETGTYVRIRLKNFDAVYIKRIVTANDVLALCQKVTKKIKHHPCVYEIGVYSGVANGIDLWCI